LNPGSGRLRQVDVLFLAFQALVLAVVAWRRGSLPSWPWFAATSLLSMVLVFAVNRGRDLPTGRLAHAVYPVLLTPLYYTELGLITTESGLVYDQLVHRWEVALFGGQVSTTWHQVMPSPLLSWVLHSCYGLYIGVVITALLVLALRHGGREFARGVFVVAVGFYVCYAVFLVFPVAGPRYFFGVASGSAAQVLPARLVHDMLEGGSAWGTAFPSSHIVASWCAVAALWRTERRLAMALWPVVIVLAFGTVYGQFHYAVDAVAGVALALILIPLATTWYRYAGAAG
jgi:membrane-associated phospholipid phosphatase